MLFRRHVAAPSVLILLASTWYLLVPPDPIHFGVIPTSSGESTRTTRSARRAGNRPDAPIPSQTNRRKTARRRANLRLISVSTKRSTSNAPGNAARSTRTLL
jgi:hypothetical protein